MARRARLASISEPAKADAFWAATAASKAGVMLSAGASLSPEVQALHDRIAQLTAENEYLRGQVAELQAKLAG